MTERQEPDSNNCLVNIKWRKNEDIPAHHMYNDTMTTERPKYAKSSIRQTPSDELSISKRDHKAETTREKINTPIQKKNTLKDLLGRQGTNEQKSLKY